MSELSYSRSADAEPSVRRTGSDTASSPRTPSRGSRPEHEKAGASARYPVRTILFMEGDPARRIFEIGDGAVMLYKLLPDGRRQVVEVLGPGDIFGVTALPVQDCAAETLTAATLHAYERSTVETTPALQRRVTQALATKLVRFHDHAVTLGRKSALERVATFLMRFVPNRGVYDCAGPRSAAADEAMVHLAMTRQEIADYLGLTIETVSRAFSELRRRGSIVLERQDDVRITDVCRLCHLTGAH